MQCKPVVVKADEHVSVISVWKRYHTWTWEESSSKSCCWSVAHVPSSTITNPTLYPPFVRLYLIHLLHCRPYLPFSLSHTNPFTLPSCLAFQYIPISLLFFRFFAAFVLFLAFDLLFCVSLLYFSSFFFKSSFFTWHLDSLSHSSLSFSLFFLLFIHYFSLYSVMTFSSLRLQIMLPFWPSAIVYVCTCI